MNFFPKINEYLAHYENELKFHAYQKVIFPKEQWKMAQIVGIAQQDWEKIQQQFDDYLKYGQSLPQNSEEDKTAIILFFRKMVSVFPPNADLYYELAHAHFIKWRQNFKGLQHIEMAHQFVHLALQMDEQHFKSKELLPQIDYKRINKLLREDKMISWILKAAFMIIISLVSYFVVKPIFQKDKDKFDLASYNHFMKQEGFVNFIQEAHAQDFELDVYSSSFRNSQIAGAFSYQLNGYLTNHGTPYMSISGSLEFKNEAGEIVFAKEVDFWNMLQPDHDQGDILPISCFILFPDSLFQQKIPFHQVNIKIASLTLSHQSYTTSKGNNLPIIYENNAPNKALFTAHSRIHHFETFQDSCLVLEYLGKKPVTDLSYQIEWALENGKTIRSEAITVVDDFLNTVPILEGQKRLGRLTPFSEEIKETDKIIETKILLSGEIK